MQISIDSALSPDGISFWEEKFPKVKLLKMQRDNPAVFAAQYQNDVEAMRELVPIKSEWVKSFKFAELNRYGLYYQIAVDPGGVKEKEENSPTGVSVVGAQSMQTENFGSVYALESKCLHVDTWTLAKTVVNLWEQYDKCRIVVEDVALQSIYQDVFEKEAKLRNHFDFPIFGIKGSELKDKITLARSVTHFFTRGNIYIDSAHTPDLYRKLEDYPTPGTDDVNALLINLYDLKVGWVKNVEPRQKARSRQDIKKHSVTGY